MSFKILGIEVSRQTNVLAFSAFLMSFGSLFLQTVNMARAPDVVMDGPKIVTFYVAKGGDGQPYVRLISDFTYLNMGTPGYDDYLKSEAATVRVDSTAFKLDALSYVKTESQGVDLRRTFLSDATPLSLKSGDVYSHETEFMFFPKEKASDDPTRLSHFLSILKSAEQLSVTFHVESYKGNLMEKTCYLKPRNVHWYLNGDTKTVDSLPAAWSANVCESS